MPLLSTLGNIGKNILGALPVVGGIIQGNMNAKIARENTDKTIAANKYLAEYQYSKDLEMWNRGNVYNSPDAQMQRLKSAGLNPNMVYGSGSAAGIAAGQLPKYNAPTVSHNYVPPVDIPSLISQFQDFRMRSAQIRNTDEQVEQRGYQNDLLNDTYWARMIQERAKGQAARINMDFMNEGGLSKRLALGNEKLSYQNEFTRAAAQRVRSEEARLISATRNLDLQNEWYAAKTIADLFGKGISGLDKVMGMTPLGRGAGAVRRAKGALGTGTIGKRLDALEMGSYYGSKRYK